MGQKVNWEFHFRFVRKITPILDIINAHNTNLAINKYNAELRREPFHSNFLEKILNLNLQQ